jgi:hypothetical protein
MKMHFIFATACLTVTSHLVYSMSKESTPNRARTLSDAAVLNRMENYLKNELIIEPSLASRTIDRNGMEEVFCKTTDHGYIYRKPESMCIHLITHKSPQSIIGIVLKHQIKDDGSIETNFYMEDEREKWLAQSRDLKRYWQNLPEYLITKSCPAPEQYFKVRKS